MRLYVIVATLAVFFALWTNIAIHPWKSQSAAAPVVPGSSAVAMQIVPAGEDGESVRLVPAQSSAQVVSAKPVTTTRTS
jgi:hypothetical protein